VVGQSKYGFWARVADTFVKGRFDDIEDAKRASEIRANVDHEWGVGE